MCLYPRLIRNRKYLENKKNGGNVPPVNDIRTTYVPIGCQNCIECRKQKSREWQVRLLEDIKTNTNAHFIALTLSNQSFKQLQQQTITHIKKDNNGKQWIITTKIEQLEGYEKDNATATIAVRLFLERWRKQYKKSLRHWLVTELGHKGTENIHLHGLVWTNEPITEVTKHWKYGFTWTGYTKNGKRINYVNAQTVNYMTKYVSKIDLQHKHYKPIILTSDAIGQNYTKTYNATKNKFKPTDTIQTYQTSTGHQMALPIYWRNKLYNAQERETLWLQQLDKQTRYVCGQKIDISLNTDTYYKALDFHRQRNIQLGYGDNKTNWKRKEYEKRHRQLMHETRLKNS